MEKETFIQKHVKKAEKDLGWGTENKAVDHS